MEYKALIATPKQIDGRTVTGFAAITGNIDSGYDRIRFGAFRKTIKENGTRARHLWMHDPWQPPTAAIKELSEVPAADLPDQVRAEYPEATGGLMVVREYLDTPRGSEILAGIEAGAISEMSFGYDPIKFDFEEVPQGDQKIMVRNLKELRLWDTSDVTWGMNAATVAAKLNLAPMLPAYKESIPPEQFRLLTELVTVVESAAGPLALKDGRVLSARNLERLKNALDTLQEILLAAEPPADNEAAKALTALVLRRVAIAERELTMIAL